MINYRVIIYFIGFLVFVEGLLIGICSLISFLFGDGDAASMAISSVVISAIGAVGWLFNRSTDKIINKRDGYIIVTFAWLAFSFFGALPFYISGAIPNYTDAFFETISGFTTTGASILNDIESLSHGILFWRSLTQWLGGMGIIVMSVAILPILGIGGMQLFVAEVPGPTPDRLHPRIKETAQRLWVIYMGFTFVQTILLWLGGMTLFDAICHAFTTMATGGYSTKQASIAHFDSAYIEYVIIIFMFIAGANFTLSYFALHMNFKKVIKNEEFRSYVFFVLLFSLVITLVLIFSGYYGFETAIRKALFQVISIITTTGYVTADYLAWPTLLTMLIFILMFLGGSSGSTGGGIKIMRIVLLIKNGFYELKRLLHPNAIIPVKFNGKVVSADILSNILAFVMFYIFLIVIGLVVMAAFGMDIETSFGAVATSLGNIGPGIGEVGPMVNFANVPQLGKWFLSFLMLVGRLELFTVLILFSRSYWKD